MHTSHNTLASWTRQMLTCPVWCDTHTSLCKQTGDPVSHWCCLWFVDCVWSAHKTLSLSICYWSFSFPAILTADLKLFHPDPLNRAEHHRHGQSDNLQLKWHRLSELVEQTREAWTRLVHFDLFSCYSGGYKWVHIRGWHILYQGLTETAICTTSLAEIIYRLGKKGQRTKEEIDEGWLRGKYRKEKALSSSLFVFFILFF